MVWTYNAKITRVVDGDTFDAEVDLGFRVLLRERFRLYGLNTPETYGVAKDGVAYAAGVAAKSFVEGWIFQKGGHEGAVAIRSHDGRPLRGDKYGRWLATVFPPGEITIPPNLHPYHWDASLNAALIEKGHAVAVTY